MPNNKVPMTNETPVFAVRVRLINTERLLRHQILEQFDPFAIIQRLQQALGHEGVRRRFCFFDVFPGHRNTVGESPNRDRRIGFFFNQPCDDSPFFRHDDTSLEVATDDGIGGRSRFRQDSQCPSSRNQTVWGRVPDPVDLFRQKEPTFTIHVASPPRSWPDRFRTNQSAALLNRLSRDRFETARQQLRWHRPAISWMRIHKQ